MIERIKSNPVALLSAQEGRWDDCVTELNSTAVATRKPVESARFTWVGLQKSLGDALYLAIRTKIGIALRTADAAASAAVSGGNLQAVQTAVAQYEALKSLTDALSSGQGPSFADDQTQSNIDGLSSLLTSEEIAALKALGYNAKPVVTADDCKAAWAGENRAAFDVLWNEHASPVLHDLAALKVALVTISEAL